MNEQNGDGIQDYATNRQMEESEIERQILAPSVQSEPSDIAANRVDMPSALNDERYSKVKMRYGVRGPVDREAFLMEFAKGPYSAMTWLEAAGGEWPQSEREAAAAEDVRYRDYLWRPPRRLSTCNPMNHVGPRKKKTSDAARLRNRQEQD